MRIEHREAMRLVSTCTILVAIGCAAPAVAEPPIRIPPPTDTVEFPAGVACEFPLQLELSGANFRLKKFVARDGNVVRAIIAGKGSFMTFTNAESSAALSVKAYGFAAHRTDNVDGTYTEIVTGHVALILFPTDVPAGPSTTLYVGRLVATFDADTFATVDLQSFTGKSTDICAALQ